jgi:hypothetical protein
MTMTTTPIALGSSPDTYDGTPSKTQAFWSALENYFYLNNTLFMDENRKIATALTFFKIGTPAREWAQDKQKIAMAAVTTQAFNHFLYFLFIYDNWNRVLHVLQLGKGWLEGLV